MGTVQRPRSAGLISEIDAMYGGFSRVGVLSAAFAAAELLVPTVGGDHLVTGTAVNSTWVCVFTSTVELARFAAARAGSDNWGRLVMTGAQLRASTALGIAVDAAGKRPLLLPCVETGVGAGG